MTEAQEILDKLTEAQKAGSAARSVGSSFLDNPYYKAEAMPRTSGLSIKDWERLALAWELGWRVEDHAQLAPVAHYWRSKMGAKIRMFKVGKLTGNSHGPNFTTLRSTWQIVPLGRRDGTERRTRWGWRFYIYWKDGSCIYFDWYYRNGKQHGWKKRT